MEFPSSFPAGDDTLRLSSAFTADELEVAAILLALAAKSDDCIRFPPSWGAKRRRSAVYNPPPAAGKSDYSSNSPNSPLLFPSDSGSNRSLPITLQEVKRTKLSRDELMAENMKLPETEQLNDGSNLLALRLMSQAESSAQPLGIPQSKEVGPKGIIIIPDLNAPVDEFLADVERPQPSDLSQPKIAAAAQRGAEAAALARRHRCLIQMSKRARRGNK